jgi:diguanylate cyclase (GGDEF)-like protein
MSTIFSAIITDIIGIIVLLFTIYLVKKNIMLTKVKTHNYNVASILTFTVICLGLTTLILSKITNCTIQIPNIIINVLKFSLTQFIPISLAFLYDDNLYKYQKRLAIPLYFQVALYIISIWYGWKFSVSVYNKYISNPLFILSALVSLYSFIILMYAYHRSSKEYDRDQRIYLFLLSVLVLIASVIQMLFQNILLIGICVSISLLLYYIFLREEQVKFDPMTRILNRSSFDKKIAEIQKLDIVTIVVLDLNNLKIINDTWGHIEGDNCLVDVANIIKLSFKNIGIAYRIGGDEFCVLCEQVEESKLIEAFTMLELLSVKRENNPSVPFAIAYGYEIYKKAEANNIFDSFTKADLAMYAHKLLLKNQSNM